MAFRWWADDCPFIVLLGSSFTPHKNVKVGPPLAKQSGSAHAYFTMEHPALTVSTVMENSSCLEKFNAVT